MTRTAKSVGTPVLVLALYLGTSLLGAEPNTSGMIEYLKKLGARFTFDDEKRVVGVNLGERKVTDVDLAHVQGLKHLRELDLTRTKVTAAGLKHLGGMTNLKKLFLTDTKVDDSGAVHLKGLRSLEVLGLSGTRITDATLERFHDLTRLKQLYCLGTGVTDAGAESLQKRLPGCQVVH